MTISAEWLPEERLAVILALIGTKKMLLPSDLELVKFVAAMPAPFLNKNIYNFKHVVIIRETTR